jgi:hypothetical protein
MSLEKIAFRIPSSGDLVMIDEVIGMITHVDTRQKFIMVDTASKIIKIPLKKYDIYQLQDALVNLEK